MHRIGPPRRVFFILSPIPQIPYFPPIIYILSSHITDPMSLKVIVVEDDAVISMKIEQDLLDAGHVVLDVVHNSERALDAIHNNQPDMVLLDINIDGTRDGIEVATIINEKYDIPFIFITAYSDVNTLERAKVTNPCGYIVKPYKASDLYTTLTIGLFNYQSKKEEEGFYAIGD